MTLTFVSEAEAAAVSDHLSVILYGPEKIGKTTAALSAPPPIVHVNADARSALRFARRKHYGRDIREIRVVGRSTPRDPATAMKTLEDVFLYVRDNDDVKTVVLDPVGRIYDLVLDAIGGQKPSLPDRGDANTWVERYVNALLELPVNVVLVAHDHGYKVATTETGEEIHDLFPFCGSNSNPALAKKLMRPFDIVAYCGRVKGEREGEQDRYLAQLFHGGGRRGGDRTGVLGDSRELDLSEWADAVSTAYAPPADAKTSKKQSKES